ncbi:unnamed protein product [Gemmataceae bacterium]|nr:unnamed protein product [Gemmataceae bacterium]VTT96523.1 unnamed protein product [Gemmataceae bacterium]
MLFAFCAWVWGIVWPWLAFVWAQALHPLLCWALHCCGLLWLGERAGAWWAGR